MSLLGGHMNRIVELKKFLKTSIHGTDKTDKRSDGGGFVSKVSSVSPVDVYLEKLATDDSGTAKAKRRGLIIRYWLRDNRGDIAPGFALEMPSPGENPQRGSRIGCGMSSASGWF